MEESITCRGPCKKVWAKFGRSSFLRHVKQAKKCKEKYSENEIIELEKAGKERQLKRKRDCYDSEQRNKKYQRSNKETELKRQQDCYDSEQRSKKYKKSNKENELERQRNVYSKKSLESRLKHFEKEKQYGPIFTCICCLGDGFKRSVKKITDNYLLFLHGSGMIKFLQINNDSEENDLDNILKESLKVFGDSYLCMTCCKSLDKLEMPQCVQKIAWNIPQFLPVCKYLILKGN